MKIKHKYLKKENIFVWQIFKNINFIIIINIKQEKIFI